MVRLPPQKQQTRNLTPVEPFPGRVIITIITIIIIVFGPYWSLGCLKELTRHPDPGPDSRVVTIIIIIIIILILTIIIIIIVFGPYWSIDSLQELTRHPDPGPASQVVTIIIIIIIIIVFGPYWSLGHLQELSRHPDPGPASQVATIVIIIIIIIIITFGPYWNLGHLQDHLTRQATSRSRANLSGCHHHHHHHCLWPLLEPRPPPRALQASRSWARLSSCRHHHHPHHHHHHHHHHYHCLWPPYWSIGRLHELSRHPDPGPVSQVVTIIIIIIPYCPYWSTGLLKSSPGIPILGQPLKMSPAVTSLFQPPESGARCFMSGLALSFPVSYQ